MSDQQFAWMFSTALLVAGISLPANADNPPHYIDGNGVEMSKGQIVYVNAQHNDYGNQILGTSRLVIRNTDPAKSITIVSAKLMFNSWYLHSCLTSPVTLTGFQTWSTTSSTCTDGTPPSAAPPLFPHFLVEWSGNDGHVSVPKIRSAITVMQNGLLVGMTVDEGQVVGVPASD